MIHLLDLSDPYSCDSKVIEKRKQCENIISCLLEYKYTIRLCSEQLMIPRSTIHYIIHHFIKFYYGDKYVEVKSLLKYNKENRFKPRRQWR